MESDNSDDKDDDRYPPAVASTPSSTNRQRIERLLKNQLRARRKLTHRPPIKKSTLHRQLPLFACPQAVLTNRKVVDLFACIGGFSTGAANSGHEIVLAVDCDPVALQVHSANHANTKHHVMMIGPETEEELALLIRSLIPECTAWHLHGSPPCTKLSSARLMSRKRDPSVLEEGCKQGLGLVNWYLDFVIRMAPTSWSMEQVSCPLVRDTLDRRKRVDRHLLDYNITNFVDYGIPQTRTRVIAGYELFIPTLHFYTILYTSAHTCTFLTLAHACKHTPNPTLSNPAMEDVTSGRAPRGTLVQKTQPLAAAHWCRLTNRPSGDHTPHGRRTFVG